MDGERPRIGVAVIVQREGQVLLGQRLGSHGAGGLTGILRLLSLVSWPYGGGSGKVG